MKTFERFRRGFIAVLFTCVPVPAVAETIWVDVRSAMEHKIDHIDGDMRVSNSAIVNAINELELGKDTDIRLYCRSGRRAGVALERLVEAGYTNVKNVGSIGKARELRGLGEAG